MAYVSQAATTSSVIGVTAWFCAGLLGCGSPPAPQPAPAAGAATSAEPLQPVEADSLAALPDVVAESALVDVRSLDSRILVELRYATTNNFTGAVLPGYGAQRALLRRDPARALTRVEVRLRASGLGLRIWDAYRPVRATAAMVTWAERVGRTDLLDQEYIARRSRHNLGVAVDLTLVDLLSGTELDMGTPFDTFTEAAHTANAAGPVQRNRQVLVQAMESEGFQNYDNEWWHFSYPLPGARPFDLPIQ
jgi:D-alanyl-D-alanine dipeptidase